MDYDHYQLFELLDDCEAHTINHNGTTYTLRFMGDRVGSSNYLSVTSTNGKEKRFGWGWGSEQVMRALDHLEKGWDTPQQPPYRPDNQKEEVKGAEWVDVKGDY